jgi:hypothetical protein
VDLQFNRSLQPALKNAKFFTSSFRRKTSGQFVYFDVSCCEEWVLGPAGHANMGLHFDTLNITWKHIEGGFNL